MLNCTTNKGNKDFNIRIITINVVTFNPVNFTEAIIDFER